MRDSTGDPHRRRRLAGLTGVLLAVLLVPTALVGCSTGQGAAMATMTPAATVPAASAVPPTAPAATPGAPAATTPGDAPTAATGDMVEDGMGGQMTRADAAAWAARPDFVKANGAGTELAYAYAIEHPEVISWMPCYCGCAAMGHENNLDCYLKPRRAGGPLAFEEHASFCDVCVKIALTAKALREQGRNLSQIRQSVDQTFSKIGPGTPTKLPPAT